jgi:hypothetical protein
MDSYEDMARDEWYSNLAADISEQAIDQFALERLRSYYLSNIKLAQNTFEIYKEAKHVIEYSPSAALVLATATIEVGLKVTLLKPIVYGMVHNESVADLVSDIVVKNAGYDRFKPLISKIVKEYGGIDLNSFSLAGRSSLIWHDIETLVSLRNSIVHRAERASKGDSILALLVADYLIGIFLPLVLKSLNLKLSDDNIIISD